MIDAICFDCDWKDNCLKTKCATYANKNKRTNVTNVINDIMAALSHHLNDYPKKFFVSYKLYKYLQEWCVLDAKSMKPKIYGIDVEVFNADTYNWWFAWENYEYKEEEHELRRTN